MSLLGGLVDFATQVISTLGYPGIFLLMVLESMIFPVPSEAVMPFAGFLVATGRFAALGPVHGLWLVTIAATLGSVAGSAISYGIGARWGEPFVHRFGKWFLITRHDWELTQRFFRRTGGWSVFLARFVPVVRHLISLPAGAVRMRRGPFLLATTIGAFLWNGFLAYLGWRLGSDWETIRKRLEPFDLLIAGLLLLAALVFILLHVRRLRQGRPEPPP